MNPDELVRGIAAKSLGAWQIFTHEPVGDRLRRFLRPNDLECICACIERDNPEAASNVAKIIYEGRSQLKEFLTLGTGC